MSEGALIQHAQKLLKEHPDSTLNQIVSQPDDIKINSLTAAYSRNEKWVVSLINDAALALGGVVAHLLGAMNINHIIISGLLSYFEDNVLTPIRRSIRNGTLQGLSNQIKFGFQF